jgi:hypothetical protein
VQRRGCAAVEPEIGEIDGHVERRVARVQHQHRQLQRAVPRCNALSRLQRAREPGSACAPAASFFAQIWMLLLNGVAAG